MKIIVTPHQDGIATVAHRNFYALVRVQATPEDCDGRESTPIHVALVVDRSGSMSGGKLEEAKRCVANLIERLTERDQVAVVDYDDDIHTSLSLMPALTAQQIAPVALANIHSGGTTALHGGWLRGAELLAGCTTRGAVSRVVLLSDGQANVGLQHADEICPQVAALAAAGVTTTTVGIGNGFNEELMVAMARAGQGGSHYGERLEDLAEAFDAELGLLKAMAFRDVRLTIEGDAARYVQVANGYAQVEDGYQLPAIACGSEAWALLKMPMRDAVLLAQAGRSLRIRISALDGKGQPIIIEHDMPFPPQVTPDVFHDLPRDELVSRRRVEIKAADIQIAARTAARRGLWDEVERAIEKLRALGEENEWIKASVPFLERLMQERDEESFSKESYHKAHFMRSRLSALDESPRFSRSDELSEAEFLRRKMAQGRRSE